MCIRDSISNNTDTRNNINTSNSTTTTTGTNITRWIFYKDGKIIATSESHLYNQSIGDGQSSSGSYWCGIVMNGEEGIPASVNSTDVQVTAKGKHVGFLSMNGL